MFVSGLYLSGWTFRHWLSDVVGIVWPIGFYFGMLLLVAAHATKETGGIDEAYRFMRGAALSFLLSVFALWLVFRGFI
jgi:hypothetical protein